MLTTPEETVQRVNLSAEAPLTYTEPYGQAITHYITLEPPGIYETKLEDKATLYLSITPLYVLLLQENFVAHLSLKFTPQNHTYFYR